MKRDIKTLFGIMLQVFALVLAGLVGNAQSENLVYIDSVYSGPGHDVSVRFCVRNTDSVASLSIPITYDTSILTIKSLSFSGSRIADFSNKLTTPATITQANGHFVVAAFRIAEAPVAPGDGYIFTATFGVASTAAGGSVAKIDSLFYPPGGELLLVQATTAKTIRPSFRPGAVTVSTRPPTFAALGDQSVLEGDTLKLDVMATDPIGAGLTLSLTTKPTGAILVDNGNGTGRVIWAPDFVGPNSSDMSPFVIGVRATNGIASTDIQTHIAVINKDRAPVVSAVSSVQAQAGIPVSFTVSATDLDFDAITWTATGLPVGATFDNKNPGTINWSPAITDSGSSVATFVAADPIGFSDTAVIALHVAKTIIYALRLDTVSTDPNTTVSFYVNLDNKLPVSSYRLLFNYDPSVLTLISLTKAGTRSASLPIFDVTYNVNDIPGNVRVVGNVNSPGETTNAPLAAENGAIVKLTFRTSGSIAYAGQYVPVRFQFQDAPANNDNTLTDSLDVKIEQGQITYEDGSVQINSLGTVNVGDINLNGLAYEISDVIYFSNFFISPSHYPFNALQYANSDINGDNLVATIADLVTLIYRVINGSTSGKAAGDVTAPVEFVLTAGNGLSVISASSEAPIGGILLTLQIPDGIDESQVVTVTSDLTAITHREGQTVRVLLYDMQGRTLPSGNHDLVSVSSSVGVTISEVAVSSVGGQLMSASIGASRELPTAFSLSQNYPNPFNPETNIEFALASQARVHLAVYNLLGQHITTLAAGVYPAGVHSVVWRGTDDQGRAVASGMYFYRLETPDNSRTRKMMLLK